MKPTYFPSSANRASVGTTDARKSIKHRQTVFGNKGTLVIALDAITTLTSSGGKVYGDLYATASMAPASITPVPEPASYALMLAGFGVIAFVARRRTT